MLFDASCSQFVLRPFYHWFVSIESVIKCFRELLHLITNSIYLFFGVVTHFFDIGLLKFDLPVDKYLLRMQLSFDHLCDFLLKFLLFVAFLFDDHQLLIQCLLKRVIDVHFLDTVIEH